MKKASQPEPCAYHRCWNYYNHNGHLPCGVCADCRYERKVHERNLRWNAATEAGAKVNR